MTRVVVDTGIFVTALIGARGSPPDQVVGAMIDDRIEVIVRPQLLAELARVLRRPKFKRYLSSAAADELIERVRRHATVVADPVDPPPLTRDPDDDYLVALARGEHASLWSAGTVICSKPGCRIFPSGPPATSQICCAGDRRRPVTCLGRHRARSRRTAGGTSCVGRRPG